MSTLTLPLPSGRGYRRSSLISLGLKIAAGIPDGLHMLRRYKALVYKTDAELAEIGLKREDLPRTIVAGRCR
jgi:hypothetical protein